jgi:hypothetical protein
LSTTTSGAPWATDDVDEWPEDEPELLQAATPIARMVAAARVLIVLWFI